MRKRTFVIYGLLVLLLAVGIPWLVFGSKGDSDADLTGSAAGMTQAKELFETNCGNCHTLYAGGTDGNFGPNLDETLAPSGPPSEEEAATAIKSLEGRVLNAIEKGVDGSTPGRMPAGIVSDETAKEIAEFVATTAGQG